MSDIAIRVKNLSKQYHIGQLHHHHDTLRDALTSGLRSLRRNPQPDIRDNDDTIWALKDVSFEVKRGEVVGIIGRNGAGKSTLLKILTRITEPTKGRAELHGRVGSLLEVGTGFHPELTGRENIYLSGTILGMKKIEIDHKFDEIVAFSGVEKFIDTPVKRYSSGMNVRLGFAVAAHLEPEILLVDEVLAVGDSAFQKKCLGKMGNVAREGRTVLFISHNLGAIEAICQRGIVMDYGSIIKDDTSAVAIGSYMRLQQRRGVKGIKDRQNQDGLGKIRLTDIQVMTNTDHSNEEIRTGQSVRFIFTFSQLLAGMSCRFTLYNHLGTAVVHFNSAVAAPEDSSDPSLGPHYICDIDEFALAPGRYWGNVAVFDRSGLQDHLESAITIDVETGIIQGRRVSPETGYGLVCLKHRWILGVLE